MKRYVRWLMVCWSLQATSAEWSLRLEQGAYLQPSSSYLHLYRGVSQSIAFSDGLWGLSTFYWERPLFVQEGFTDQESGYGGGIQLGLVRGKAWRLFSQFGGGRIHGFIKNSQDKRSFQLNTFYEQLDLQVMIAQRFIFEVGHRLMVGSFTNEEAESYVAWPFHFIFGSLGLNF